MSNRLEVQIGADKTDFDKKIKEVEHDIKDLSKVKLERIKLGLDTKEIDGNIKDAKKSLSDLKSTLKDTSDSFDKMSPKVANGGNTLMQFSRIAQDAPFGIMGIGNNITATAESFGYLSKSAGGAGGALKAIASSMLGTGGILLAVSLVTSGLTYMSQNGITVGDVFDKLTGQFDESAKALAEINKEVAKTAGEEISSLKSLIKVAQDDTQSRENRLTAVKKLQSEYPAYFGNLSREKILNGDLTGIINELSVALKERARASALSGKAGELASKELETQEKIREVYKEIFALLGTAKQEEKIKILQKLNKGNLDLTNEQVKALGILDFFKFGNLAREYKDLRDDLVDVNKQINNIQKLADRSKGKSIKLEFKGDAVKKEKAVKAVTPRSAPLDPIVPLNPITDFATSTKIAEASISSSFANLRANADVSMANTLELLRGFSADANALIEGSITSTFSNLGTAIGDALANGQNVFSAIGSSLLASLGSFLSDMGGLLIKYGTLAVVKGKLDLAIATGGPISIGAGIAAIAVGVALKGIGASISKTAQGGAKSGSASISSGADYSSPASSGGSYSSSNSGGGTVVFEISGQSLIGVLSNTVNKNTRLGGTL